MAKKTDEIKKSTIKALEPDVQAIMTKCKETIQKAQEAAAVRASSRHTNTDDYSLV